MAVKNWEEPKNYRVAPENNSSHRLRLWLKITPETDIDTIIGKIPTDAKAKNQTDLTGDLFSLIKTIDKNTNKPTGTQTAWHFPISDTLPPITTDATYGKITPEIGSSGKMMADIMGGVTKKIGGAVGKLSSAAGGAIGGFGEFIQAFSGDIDGPAIWEKSEVKPFDFKSTIAFDNVYEYQYYKAAETVMTLMTMPTLRSTVDMISKIGAKLGAERLENYILYLMQRPPSKCSFEVFVGYAYTMTKTGQPLRVFKLANSARLLKQESIIMSGFSPTQQEGNYGIDAMGVPRVMNYDFTFQPFSIMQVVLSHKRMLAANSYGFDKDTFADSPSGKISRNDDYEELSNNLGAGLYSAQQDRAAAALKKELAPGVATTIRQVVIERTANLWKKNLARAIIFNTFSINSTATAILYVGGRILRNVGPQRVIIGANGAKASMISGIPGLVAHQVMQVGRLFDERTR